MEKKQYIQPSVENTLLTMGAHIMVGSNNLNINGSEIPDGGGGD